MEEKVGVFRDRYVWTTSLPYKNILTIYIIYDKINNFLIANFCATI